MDNTTATSAESSRVGTGNGTGSVSSRFKPGNAGRPGRRTGPEKGTRLPSQMLKDMRWVYSHEVAKDRTQGHRHCRRWLNEDPKGFLSHMSQLEKAHAQWAGKAQAVSKEEPPAETEEVDEGTQRVMELLEEEWKALMEWTESRRESSRGCASKPSMNGGAAAHGGRGASGFRRSCGGSRMSED